jgi:hypothetical protein
MKHFHALFVSCLLVILAAGTASADTIGLLSKTTLPMPWFHRNGNGLVLEITDSGDILSTSKRTGTFNVLMTARKMEATEINLRLSLINPRSGKCLAELSHPNLKLSPDTTYNRTFQIKLSAATAETLSAEQTPFNLSSLLVKAVFTDAATGTVLPALVDEGNFGFARTATAPPPQAAVVKHGGVPMLRINDRVYPGLSGYVGWNWIPARQTIKNFADSGRHIYEIVFQPWSLWRAGKLDANRFEHKMNEMVASIVGRDPKALIFVRWWLYVPRDWENYYPDGRITYDDGSHHMKLLGGPWAHASYASQEWLQQYSDVVREATRRLVKSSYADRIFMVRVGYGNCGEWNSFGYHEQKFPGFSEPMRRRYVAWLRGNYKTLAAVNTAWGASFTSWDEIKVPSRQERLRSELGSFRDPAASGNYREFYRFFSEFTVELIDHFGQIIKSESANQLLYGVFYGYFTHHLTAPPYHSLDSGHYAMGKLLDSTVVDTICSPYSYRNRGNNIGFGIPIDSVKAHGKLFLSEQDLPTHLADRKRIRDKSQLFCTTPELTNTFYWRDYAKVLTSGVAGYWYDFAHKWYLNPEFKQLAERVSAANDVAASADNSSVAEVAVILDEESIFDLSLHSGPYGKRLYDNLVHIIDQAGAPWDCYLSSDIDQVVAKKYKLLVFANQFRQNPAIAEALKSYRGSVAWIYGAGQFSGKHCDSSPDWTGIKVQFEQKSENRLLKGHNTSVRMGDKIVPAAYVTDARAEVLATYPDGRCGFASVPRPGGKTYYYSLPHLAPHVIRWLYLSNRVHVYTRYRGAYVYANKSFVAVWQQKPHGGEVVVTLPHKPSAVTDLWTGKSVPVSGQSVRFECSAGKPFVRLLHIK